MSYTHWQTDGEGGDADFDLLMQGAGVSADAASGIVRLWQAERQQGEPLLNFLSRARVITADDVRNVEAVLRSRLQDGRPGTFFPMATALRLRKFSEELLRRAPSLSASIRPSSLGRIATPTRGVPLDTLAASAASPRAAAGPTTVAPGYTPKSPPWEPERAPPGRRVVRESAPTVAVTPNGAIEPGAYVGKILIERKLGEGGFGAVFAGMHTRLRVRVAVKALHAQHGVVDDSALARFLAEARLQAQMNHVAIVRIWDLEDEHRPPYLVMEYMDGPSLQQLLASSGRLAVPRALAIARRVAWGLEAAALAGIVHRDIKPANLLTNRAGEVKISDFGQATLVEAVRRQQLSIRSDPTHAVFGTTEYMAPEHAQGTNVDPRSDIYSLGATLFHMVCGRPPFQGKNPFQTVFQAASEPLPDPRQFEPSLPAGIVELLQRMLARNPAERCGSHGEVVRALGALGVE